jgi:hypothetical protein
MRLLPPAAIVSVFVLSACAPSIRLDRTEGVPHTLVGITGSRLDGGTIIWDAGTPNETVIPGSMSGAYLFSVPPSATATTPTSHSIRVKHGWHSSNVVTFTVRPTSDDTPVPFTNPRIDSIMMNGTHFDGTQVSVSLYVQGANIDVGAVVKVKPMLSADVQNTSNLDGDGYEELATVTDKGLRCNWFGVSQTEMDYPISHFVSLIAILDARRAGSLWSVEVENLDGKKSLASTFEVPTDEATLDSDGDGLLDTWETNGYPAPDGIVSLAPFGVKPYRRDILVELDSMPTVPPGSTTQGGLRHPISRDTLDAVRAMFNAAPFLNPRDPPGINLYVDASDTTIGYSSVVCFPEEFACPPISTTCPPTSSTSGVQNYTELKRCHFNNERRGEIFHYGIWADSEFAPDIFGQSDMGDDFLITMDSKDPSFQTVRTQAEVLAHELGHDLGQLHGGANGKKYKPTYWSVMAYTWEKRTGQPAEEPNLPDPPIHFRIDHATCLPFYYGKAEVDEVNGEPPLDAGTAIDYSSGMAKVHIQPPQGSTTPDLICGKPINWKVDANFGSVGDYANWPRLFYRGPAMNGDIPDPPPPPPPPPQR